MMFTKVAPIRLYETVTDQIMNLIKSKELKPGDRLPPERELAEKFAISRASLREAFRVLESKGLILSTPGGGRFIREMYKGAFNDAENVILNLEKSSILELLEAREIFEVKIVELAAQRATAEDLKAIEESFNKMSRLIGRKNGEAGDEEKTDLDTEFHLTIARASHNFVCLDIMRLHFDLLKDTRKKTWRMPGRREQQIKEHHSIVKAIKEKNSKKAAKAMLTHLKHIRKIVTKV